MEKTVLKFIDSILEECLLFTCEQQYLQLSAMLDIPFTRCDGRCGVGIIWTSPHLLFCGRRNFTGYYNVLILKQANKQQL